MITVVFAFGVFVFALTVYGTVMAGGLAMTKRQIEEDPILSEEVDPDELFGGLPSGMKY
jgi:hypothetical protein